MRRSFTTPRDRARSLAGGLAVNLLLGYALLTGLGVAPLPLPGEDPMVLLDLPEPVPDPPATPMTPEVAPSPTERPKDPEGAAAPPALRNTPTPVVAPPPIVKLPVPPPLAAAPVAGTGTAPAAGAAEVPGPGTGRGGVGDGLGSGRFGTGNGGGGSGGLASAPRYRSGSIEWRDVPLPVLARQPRGTVRFRMLIGVDGRVGDCRITGSSGFPGLDQATCAAARRRLRWFPATDPSGSAVEAWVPGSNQWIPRPGTDTFIDAEEVRD